MTRNINVVLTPRRTPSYPNPFVHVDGVLRVARVQKLFSLDERKLGSKGKQKFSPPKRVLLVLFSFLFLFFTCYLGSTRSRCSVFSIKYRERRSLERVARCLTNVCTCEACSRHDTR